MQTAARDLTICAKNVERLVELRREIDGYSRQIQALFHGPVYDLDAHDRLSRSREVALYSLLGCLDGSGLSALWKQEP